MTINKVDYIAIKSKSTVSKKGKTTTRQSGYVFRVRCEDGWHNLNEAIGLGIVARSEESERLTGSRSELVAKIDFLALFRLVGLKTPDSVKMTAMDAKTKLEEMAKKREDRERQIVADGLKKFVKTAKDRAETRFAKLEEKYADETTSEE